MPRLISDLKKRNLWGVSADANVTVLEPQRADLWYIDFTNVVQGIRATGLFKSVPDILPQLAQSVVFPEDRVKAEVYRRDSVPYQMPSWDEPLEPVKITFLLDSNTEGGSSVYTVMSQWRDLTRAGRGFRSSGYLTDSAQQMTPGVLDQNFKATFRFDLFVSFLRGVNNGVATDVFSDLDDWLKLKFQQAWVGGLKVSDLSYTNNGLVTFDATLHVESIEPMASA